MRRTPWARRFCHPISSSTPCRSVSCAGSTSATEATRPRCADQARLDSPRFMERMSDSFQETVQIIYDGQCPACDAYFRFQRLKQSGINAQFIDAREHPEIVRAFSDRGIDL